MIIFLIVDPLVIDLIIDHSHRERQFVCRQTGHSRWSEGNEVLGYTAFLDTKQLGHPRPKMKAAEPCCTRPCSSWWSFTLPCRPWVARAAPRSWWRTLIRISAEMVQKVRAQRKVSGNGGEIWLVSDSWTESVDIFFGEVVCRCLSLFVWAYAPRWAKPLQWSCSFSRIYPRWLLLIPCLSMDHIPILLGNLSATLCWHLRNRPLEEVSSPSPTRPREGGLIAARLARAVRGREEELPLGFLDAWLKL